jgi:hypothetical protein
VVDLTELETLTPLEFEELVYGLLHRTGYRNISWQSQYGTVDGRSIICQQQVIAGPQKLYYNCIVQCKRQKGYVERMDIFEDILKASNENVDFFLLATTGAVDASTKEWLNGIEKKFAMKIIYWEGLHIQMLLQTNHDLAIRHFAVSLDSYYLLKGLSEKYKEIATAETLLFTPVVRKIFTDAQDLSRYYSSLLCVVHLLISLLSRDKDVTQKLFLKNGIDLNAVVKDLEENVIAKQRKLTDKKLSNGYWLSFSFRLTLELTIKLMNTTQEGIISERLLLLSILSQPFSGTIHFLKRHCKINIDALIKDLFHRFFDRDETLLLQKHINSYRESMDFDMRKDRYEDTWF